MAEVQIRRYEDDDEEDVKDIFTLGMSEHVPSSCLHVLKQPYTQMLLTSLHMDLDHIRQTYLETPNACFWVAENQGQVVGTVACLPAERNKGCLELKRMSVKLSHRRQGIAKALCNTVADFARERGYPAVVLYTSVVQTDAQKLYERVGYKKVREFVIPELVARITSFTLIEYRLDLLRSEC
ncbi:putative N-acetyltransferase camello isoform X2 [Brachyhypopomus gauderio]|uniref:putative N-acetyltransferase camello isoform X2 n=1 Tax=Brachyhypopomus gauderio TaxID=698409 RepID=UPI004041F20A